MLYENGKEFEITEHLVWEWRTLTHKIEDNSDLTYTEAQTLASKMLLNGKEQYEDMPLSWVIELLK
jgi:hypothetical protein